MPAVVVDIANLRREFVIGDDGFTYWWPDGSAHGCYAANHLRDLANELDLRNTAALDHLDHLKCPIQIPVPNK